MVPMAIIFLERGARFFPEILQHHRWFPNEKRSEEPVKKFHTDDRDLSSASDWLQQIKFLCCRTNQMHYPDLGSASAGHAVREISFNQSEAQVGILCSLCSDIIS